MLKRIGTIFGYAKAPKAMFVVQHPVKGTKALLAAKGIKGLVTTPAGAALSALVMVPVGLLALKGLTRRD